MTDQYIKKVIFFVGGFAVLAVALHCLLMEGMHRYNGGGGYDVWNHIMEGKAGTDILISGSSRALINFDCEKISQGTGRRCYNIGLDGSHLDCELPLFKTYLKYNPNCKSGDCVKSFDTQKILR